MTTPDTQCLLLFRVRCADVILSQHGCKNDRIPAAPVGGTGHMIAESIRIHIS